MIPPKCGSRVGEVWLSAGDLRAPAIVGAGEQQGGEQVEQDGPDDGRLVGREGARGEQEHHSTHPVGKGRKPRRRARAKAGKNDAEGQGGRDGDEKHQLHGQGTQGCRHAEQSVDDPDHQRNDQHATPDGRTCRPMT